MEENNKYRQTLKRIENEHPFCNNTDLAYECILDQILSWDLKPGDKLLQENLSKNLDMSRTPIRDALIRLERENYLEKNGTGFQVCSFQIRDYFELCEYRLVIEPKAAFFAARNIMDEQMERLSRNMEEQRKNAGRDLRKSMALDNEFHNIIAEASGNSYILETVNSYQSRKIFNYQFALQGETYKFVKNKHEAIYDAICRRDEKAAEEAMISHLRFYAKNIMQNV